VNASPVRSREAREATAANAKALYIAREVREESGPDPGSDNMHMLE